MKKKKLMLITFLGMFILTACDLEGPDTEPPAAPTGLMSITGDEAVYLFWNENAERDLAGYRVYRNYEPYGYFRLIAEVAEPYYVDRDVQNGVTYYYAVSAFDVHGNESELSEEDCFDTPRPEGWDMRIFEKDYYPQFSGYDLSEESPCSYDSQNADFYFDYNDVDQEGYLVAVNYAEIQDMGYTESLDDINWAPYDGWDPDGIVRVVPGHSYVIWTGDNHFAKIRVNVLRDNFIIFDWAYQIAEGNHELCIKIKSDLKERR